MANKMHYWLCQMILSTLKPVFRHFAGLTNRSDTKISRSDDFCATAGGLLYPLHTCGITKSQANPEIIAACNKVILQSDTSMHMNKSRNGTVEKFMYFKHFMLAMYGMIKYICDTNLCNRHINRTHTQNGTACQQQPIPPHSPSIMHYFLTILNMGLLWSWNTFIITLLPFPTSCKHNLPFKTTEK